MEKADIRSSALTPEFRLSLHEQLLDTQSSVDFRQDCFSKLDRGRRVPREWPDSAVSRFRFVATELAAEEQTGLLRIQKILPATRTPITVQKRRTIKSGRAKSDVDVIVARGSSQDGRSRFSYLRPFHAVPRIIFFRLRRSHSFKRPSPRQKPTS